MPVNLQSGDAPIPEREIGADGDLRAIARGMIDRAKNGDVAAAELLLRVAFGDEEASSD